MPLLRNLLISSGKHLILPCMYLFATVVRSSPPPTLTAKSTSPRFHGNTSLGLSTTTAKSEAGDFESLASFWSSSTAVIGKSKLISEEPGI